MKAHTFSTREQWLQYVTKRMKPEFRKAGSAIPENVRASMSLPRKSKTLGSCFNSTVSADKHFEIFIRVDQDKPLDVAAILCHELVHAAVGLEAKHGAPFRELATALGLEGKMKATVPGETFKAWIAPILEKAGPFPGAALDMSKQKVRKTYMLKCECLSCGYVCRTTAKWLDEVGAPICPCNNEPMAEKS